jgi:hypothetical protein
MKADDKVITKLQLQSRKHEGEPWGTLNTVLIQHMPGDTEARAMKKAHAEVDSMRSRWIENYDRTLQFRVVEL